jgi:oligopeptide transport system ATP-binding protein
MTFESTAPEAILDVKGLRKTFSKSTNVFPEHGRSASRVGRFAAVDGVTFRLLKGETLAVVGESGCGKTTLARLILRLIEPDAGEIYLAGQNLLAAQGKALRTMRRQMQMIFQDPFASLNPRMQVGEIVGEPLTIHEPDLSRATRREKTAEILRRVGLPLEALDRYPHEFSGGQRQRIGIARALILRPRLVIADEPVSALDVSVGAQVLLLFRELQRELGLTCLLISHSFPVVAQIASRIAVMQSGKFLEIGTTEYVLQKPVHPYTKQLLAAVPVIPGVSST